MNLYVDVGNTNMKFGYELENKFRFYKLPTLLNYTSDMLCKNLDTFLKKHQFSYVVISSVVPSLDLVLKKFASDNLKAKVMFLSKIKKEFLNLNGRDPLTMGSDIKANALYAAKRYQKAIVISLGTATVFFKITKLKLEGVIISPGIRNSYLSLISQAKKLNEVILKIPKNNLGSNTQEALSIGVIKGNYHLIKGFLEELDPNNEYKILITGGNFELLKEILNEYTYIENMVILGLKDYYEISK